MGTVGDGHKYINKVSRKGAKARSLKTDSHPS